MTHAVAVLPDVRALIEAVCDGAAADAQVRDLEARLLTDADAREFYVDLLNLDAELQWIARSQQRGEAAVKRLVDAAQQPARAPLFPFLATLPHGTVGYFSSGWPLAYLLATVIFGIGLLIGSHVYVSEPVPIVRQSAPLPSPLSPVPSVVGRITGMADCQFEEGSGAENQKSEIRNQKSFVALGDKLALSSGLLELTYDTGAKVILQGPVTYEVESPAGGFLSIGKLTARVESTKSRAANQKSEILNHKLFVVRTPTAIVTDLGTEFGVDVSLDGDCEVHVLKGRVQTEPCDATGRESSATLLRQGEAWQSRPASTSNDHHQLARATMISFDWAKFDSLRIPRREDRFQRWLAYSQKLRKDPALVAYYTFESAGATNAILPNLSAAGSALDGRVDGGEWVYGRLPGKYALLFHGPGSGDVVVLPNQERFKFAGPFAVAVWFKAERFTAAWQALVAKGNTSWRIQQFDKGKNLSFDTNHGPVPIQDVDEAISPASVADGRWHLVVAVHEPVGKAAHNRFYVDGHLDAEGNVPPAVHQNNEPVWLGGNCDKRSPHREFEGLIDEVAIFARVVGR